LVSSLCKSTSSSLSDFKLFSSAPLSCPPSSISLSSYVPSASSFSSSSSYEFSASSPVEVG
jgi:hypothetical protein